MPVSFSLGCTIDFGSCHPHSPQIKLDAKFSGCTLSHSQKFFDHFEVSASKMRTPPFLYLV